MSVKTLFATKIYTSTIADKELRRSLLKESYIYKDLDDAGRVWSKSNYAHGYTSYSSLDMLMSLSPHFDELKHKIDQHVRGYVRSLALHPSRRKLKMVSLWINIMGKHCYHGFHLHPLSVVSGTFYLKTPKNSGVLKLEDPRIQCFMNSPRDPQSGGYHRVLPRAGQLILFESWLKHEVEPNFSSDDRVSVSFNYS